jgi:hypothetical protein
MLIDIFLPGTRSLAIQTGSFSNLFSQAHVAVSLHLNCFEEQYASKKPTEV